MPVKYWELLELPPPQEEKIKVIKIMNKNLSFMMEFLKYSAILLQLIKN
jgi:hypothetical protein